jgi:hypothetical protein
MSRISVINVAYCFMKLNKYVGKFFLLNFENSNS